MKELNKYPVSIVGAGPGAPDLLTIRALKYIEKADVILHDELFGEEILSLANKATKIVNVGKRCGDGKNQVSRQKTIHYLLASMYHRGYKTVRLKTGDPFIFGRGSEEAFYLTKQQIPFDIVPGITAGMAAATNASLPLTERGKASSVLLTTGHDILSKNSDFVIEQLKNGIPVIFYMALKKIQAIALHLLKNGMSSHLPFAIVSNVSMKNEESHFFTLGNLLSEDVLKGIESPAVVLAGKYLFDNVSQIQMRKTA